MKKVEHRSVPLVAILAGCGASAPSGDSAAIELGFLTALSGDLAGLGREFTDATQLALAEINGQGGALGRPLRMALQDDGTSAAGAQVGYSALLDHSVPVILGPTFSAAVVTIAPLIKSGRTLTIGQTTTSPQLTNLDDGGYFYRVVASDTVQAKVLGELIVGEKARGYDVEELCIVYREDVYGTALADATKREIEARQGTETIVFTSAPYSPLQTDLTSVIEACGDPATKEGKSALLFVTFVADGASILNEAIRRGWSSTRHRFFFTDGAQDQLLFTLLDDPQSINDARGIGPSGPDPGTEDGARLRDFKERFLAFFGRNPTFYAENAYDAAYLAAMAIEIAGSATDRAAVVEAMGSVSSGEPVTAGNWSAIHEAIARDGQADYLGASGHLNLDQATGDLLPPYYVAVWQVVAASMEIIETRKVE
ncbi:MAG: ABC transporter substrate-binding protein [Deltaproteobacteria bacterium]|nr:ABC transporter substrate-binding protein [Deltaproteobacteria bacterium]